MVNQKLYIINLSNFYDIISELKEHIGYEISKFDNKEIFFDKYKNGSISTENPILIVHEKDYNFFVKNINEDQIIKFKPPVNIFTFIENLNVKSLSYKSINYDIHYYGNIKILFKLFQLNNLKINKYDDICIISL